MAFRFGGLAGRGSRSAIQGGSKAMKREEELTVSVKNLTRPIIGIENRTALEAFDIMVARIEGALAYPNSSPLLSTPKPEATEGGAHEKGWQDRVADAHYALFHDDPTDVAERLARYAEETNEVLQAFGMSREDMHRLVDYTCDRPAGEPAKEIGAALLTLTSLCVVAGYDVMECGEADLEKLQRPETISRIRAKRYTRHGRGPLPGLDPSVRVVFGLEAQGHIPTVEAMLAEGHTWREIGRSIGWDGETAKQYYERHRAALTAKPEGGGE